MPIIPRGTSLACVALIYLVTMAAMVWGLVAARQTVLADLGSADSLREWQKWKAESQAKKDSPVARRPTKADEPPALTLFRDYFVAVIVTALAVGTFLFAFLAMLIRGVMRRPQAGASPS